MFSTYSAILRGRQIEWRSEKPPQFAADRAVPVHVTILEEEVVPAASDQGKRMADALEQIARLQSSSLPDDPVGWERELREDRALLGREK